MNGRSKGKLFIEKLVAGDQFDADANPPDLGAYMQMALRGGFPEPALWLDERSRIDWFNSYTSQLVNRDALELQPRRDPERLGRFLSAYALASGSMANEQTLLNAAGIRRETGLAYLRLLANLYIIDELPAWSTNRLKRLSAAPKRLIVDSGLCAALQDVDFRAAMADSDVLGRLLETFTIAQIRSELGHLRRRARLYHLRRRDGRREIDLLIEVGGEQVIGIEIKATATPRLDDARHLIWLQHQLGDRFLRGVVLHTGPAPIQLAETIHALPISTIWS